MMLSGPAWDPRRSLCPCGTRLPRHQPVAGLRHRFPTTTLPDNAFRFSTARRGARAPEGPVEPTPVRSEGLAAPAALVNHLHANSILSAPRGPASRSPSSSNTPPMLSA